jgi:hypothetical protein
MSNQYKVGDFGQAKIQLTKIFDHGVTTYGKITEINGVTVTFEDTEGIVYKPRKEHFEFEKIVNK